MTPTVPPAAAPMPAYSVLVVDDTATNRQILALFLKKLGQRVELANDGAQAVEMFAAKAYDLVIMDVMMPVMDGYEATRRIKAMCGTQRWVPVIFLSALDKDENLVAGLEAGGDDYLSKPVNFVVLEAKLRSLSRALALRRELEDARRVLQAYHDEREAENLLAAEILYHLMHRPGLGDPLLHYWMNPASHFSGDIVAAARAPDGRFYALLADATGHGLGAAICVLPAMTLFYDNVELGLTLGQVIAKINHQLRLALPVGRFVACACAVIDPASGACELWSGGMPRALMVDAAGRKLHEISAGNLPLGIADLDTETSQVESLPPSPAGGQLVLYSDGLVEARNAAGEEFGLVRLWAALAAAPPAQRLDAVKDAMIEHLGALQPHDDVSLLLLDLPAAPNASPNLEKNHDHNNL